MLANIHISIYDLPRRLIMDYRTPLTEGSQINHKKITIKEVVGYGGSCIVYSGENNNGNNIIVKECYPHNLHITRQNDCLSLDDDTQFAYFFSRKEEFRNGQINFINYHNSNSSRALCAPYQIIDENNTLYAISLAQAGKPLDKIDRNKLDVCKAATIMMSLCKAITYIHRQKKLYLDLKPANIWFEDNETPYGEVCLFDFDALTDVKNINKEFCSMSTPGYAAPEQINGEYVKIGYHTDAFAVGVVFYYLLTEDDLFSCLNNQNQYDSDRIKEITNNRDWLDNPTYLTCNCSDEVKELISDILEELLEPSCTKRKDTLGTRDSIVGIGHLFRVLAARTLGGNNEYKPIYEEIDEASTRLFKELDITKDEILGAVVNLNSTLKNVITTSVNEIYGKLTDIQEELKETHKEVKELKNFIIEKNTSSNKKTEPDSVVEIIDDDYVDYIREKYNTPADKEALLARFFNINGRSETIMGVVCCDLCVKDSNIINNILESVKDERISFLTGDGGTGKSTLLCQIAIEHHSSNAGTLYINLERSIDENVFKNNVEKYLNNYRNESEKTILLIDNPSNNIVAIEALYKLSMSNDVKNKLSIVLCDRPENLIELIEEDEYCFDNWIKLINLVYLSNNSAADNNIKLFKNYYKSQKSIIIPKQHKETIIEKWINNISDDYKLDTNIFSSVISNINYNNTIVGIIVSLENEYNSQVKALGKDGINTPKLFESDWELWSKKVQQFDGSCNENKISDVFKYISALAIMGIQIQCETIMNITGFCFSERFYEEFPEDTFLPVCITEKSILLKHDTVAEYYFSYNTRVKLTDCLEKSICYLSDDDFRKFTYKIFHFSRFYDESLIPSGIDKNTLAKLVTVIDTNNDLKEKIIKNEKLYSLELSKILLQNGCKEDAISDSLCKNFPNPEEECYSKVLRKYFMASLRNCETLPKCFLMLDSNVKCYKLTDFIGKFKNSKVVKNNEEQQNKARDWRIQIFTEMSKKHPDDVPSIIELAQAYNEKKEFKNAIFECYKYINTHKDSLSDDRFNIYTALFASYKKELADTQKEIDSLYNDFKKSPDESLLSEIDVLKIKRTSLKKDLKQKSEELLIKFNSQIRDSEFKDDTIFLNYTVFVTEYVRTLLKFRMFKEAYETLKNVPNECYNCYEVHRIYIAWGCLYQNNSKYNNNHNDDLAIENFEKAWNLVNNDIHNRKAKGETLLMLMNTYELVENNDKMIEYAKITMDITKNKKDKDNAFYKATDILNELPSFDDKTNYEHPLHSFD